MVDDDIIPLVRADEIDDDEVDQILEALVVLWHIFDEIDFSDTTDDPEFLLQLDDEVVDERDELDEF